MKIIILNRKRLGVTIIILGLMVLLFGMERSFDGRLKDATLMYNNINSLVKYEGLNKTFSYKLPQEWNTNETNFTGGEVFYHNDFSSQDLRVYGFVEVWNFKGDLKKFLDMSKESTYKPSTTKYISYNISPVTVDKSQGYKLNYTLDVGNNNNYIGYEYFIGSKDKFYRFSFFVKAPDFKETMPAVFKTIVETFEQSQ